MMRFLLFWIVFFKALIRSLIRPSPRTFQKLSREALAALNITVTCKTPLPKNYFIFANHQGWLDAPVIASLIPCRLIAKYEVKWMPLFGIIAQRFGCLFVKRGVSLNYQSHLKDEILQSQVPVVCFPEGTTNRSAGKLKLGFVRFVEEQQIPAIVVFLKFKEQEPALYLRDESLFQNFLKLFSYNDRIYCDVTWQHLTPSLLDEQIAAFFQKSSE